MSGIDESWIGEELGDVLLYVFLEQILGAPKLFSKIELLKSGGGGVHLLQHDGDGDNPSYQMVFGRYIIVFETTHNLATSKKEEA